MLDKPVKMMEVLPVRATRGLESDELKNFKMYQILDDGSLVENMGISHEQLDELVYDVTSASVGFKKYFQNTIREIDVTRIKPALKDKQDANKSFYGRIVTVMSLLGEYENLSLAEKNQLGHDFVNIESTDQGISINAVLRQKDMKEDSTHLRINTGIVSKPLLEKISSDLHELIELENGYYALSDNLQKKPEI